MVIKGGSFDEVCKQLRALKKAFVINNVSLSEYEHIRKVQQLRKICSKQLEQIFKNALPRIKQHGISCRYYKWCAGTYKDGNWEDLLKIDGKYYKITDETIKNA